MKELRLFKKDGVTVVSSRVVAEDFEKRHAHVIDKIGEKLADRKFGSLNWFIESTYQDAQGKERKEYLLTRDGFSFIVMGFTGSKADEFKIKYIDAFNQMEQNLLPRTQAEMFVMAGQAMLEMEQRQKELEQKVISTETKVDNIKEIVALNTTDWRKDSANLITKMAQNLGGNEHIQALRKESYEILEQRAKCKLSTRLTNKRQRMADEGVSLSKRKKLNHLDVIADDGKLIEIYTAVIKDMSIKYGVAA